MQKNENINKMCNILTFNRAVNQETGASGWGCQNITFTCGWVEFGADATLTGSRWALNNYITRCHRWFELVGVNSSCSSRQWEPAPDRGLAALSDPRLGSPAEWERSAAIVRGTWGQYVAVCSISNSPLTHNPFENKVWEVYFSKEVCSFVHYCWLCFCMYMYSRLAAIQQMFINHIYLIYMHEEDLVLNNLK